MVADELLQPIFQICKNVGAHGSQRRRGGA
jgi:hypothetical protein